MNVFSPQPLALLCSLILALPSGWCGSCAAAQHPAGATEDVAAGCETLAPAPPVCCKPAAEAPAAPESQICECCAAWHATLPVPPIAPDVAATAALMLPTPTALAAARIVEVTKVPPRQGPRLHVLKCVWLC